MPKRQSQIDHRMKTMDDQCFINNNTVDISTSWLMQPNRKHIATPASSNSLHMLASGCIVEKFEKRQVFHQNKIPLNTPSACCGDIYCEHYY